MFVFCMVGCHGTLVWTMVLICYRFCFGIYVGGLGGLLWFCSNVVCCRGVFVVSVWFFSLLVFRLTLFWRLCCRCLVTP